MRSTTDLIAAVAGRLAAAGCVFAAEEAGLLIDAAGSERELNVLVERREAGEPLEQLVGWAEFCGLRILVALGVFVPRRRTEYLVRLAARRLDRMPADRPAIVVDLCCGTGAIGLAIARARRIRATPTDERRRIELYAVDLDPAAVTCAAANLAAANLAAAGLAGVDTAAAHQSGVTGRVYAGDLDAPLPADLLGRVDVLVANAPYVPTSEIAMMPPEARDHEPAMALDGGPDGLDIQRRVIAAAPRWLAPDGRLLVETSERQAPESTAIAERAGLSGKIKHSSRWAATVLVARRLPEVQSAQSASRNGVARPMNSST